MLFATKTVGVTRGGAGVGVGIAVGVGVALGVAGTVAAGLVDGAEPAAPGVPQAASKTGAMRVSSIFLVIGFTSVSRGAEGAGEVPPPRWWKPSHGIAC